MKVSHLKRDEDNSIHHIIEWNLENCHSKESLFVGRLIDLGFSSQEIHKILYTIDSVCKYCWDNNYNCHCRNDE